MRKPWLRICLVLLAVLSMIAAGCADDEDGGGGGGGGGEGPIWVLLPDTATSDRWAKDDPRFFSAAFEAEGLVEGEDFTIVNAEGDVQTQQGQVEQAIADDASVIVLTSLDPGSGATFIETAEDAGVAVVEYDRFNTEGPGGAAYVSFDNVQVGQTMAEVLEPEIDALSVAKPQVVMLNGGEEDNNSFLFRAGYAETVEARAEAGDWEIVADQHVPGWDNAEAQTLMEQILVDANNNVDAVFAANDGLANSAINAIEAAGIGPVPVSGQDATSEGMQNILLGRQAMSVYKPIEAEADVAAAVALALRAGEDPSGITSEADFSIIGIEAATGEPAEAPEGEGVVPYFALVPIGVTADNMADTVIADGFRTWDEICTGEVAKTDVCKANA